MADSLAKYGVYIDDLSKIRVLEPEAANQTHKLREECQSFVSSESDATAARRDARSARPAVLTLARFPSPRRCACRVCLRSTSFLHNDAHVCTLSMAARTALQLTLTRAAELLSKSRLRSLSSISRLPILRRTLTSLLGYWTI
ncbi:PREDICTED: uncharacterized protein LOC105565352 isoform X1 [Vollenhovia emeryi]|uniref:uncharacterized protein LOC105565352 isoform X1 n=1 Tax=Vollenhovia emeryi TaxID=411798 RepID=UPI0005F4590F|nr:PREDICTED: uncharacterized protein LOC105565352 isoform X1 [Vollenhovia emeryi]